MPSIPRTAAVAVLVLHLALAGCGGGGGGDGGSGSGGGGSGGGGGGGITPPAGPGAYESGTYPDLFVDLLGKTSPEVQARIDAVFQQLFYGSDSQRIYYPVGADMAYVLDTGNGDVRSEGMSYGMMIAVQLDKHAEFDRLWMFARTYMWQPSGAYQDYFAWHTDTSGNKLSQNPASDGEEWFATALLLAANRWGSGTGIFDYQAEAQRILDVMLHKEEQADHGTVTNMFDAATHQVVFVPSGASATYTDPSYHLPHFYELWARWGDKDQAFWCAAAAAGRAFLPTAANATTGLAPDYAHFDGTPNALNGHGDFRFDAHRVAGNLGMDQLWFRADPWQVEEADRLLSFFHARKAAEGGTYSNQYTLSGAPIGSPHGAGLTAMNAVAALAASNTSLRTEFVQDLWDASTPTGTYRYYDGVLYLLGLLEVSGNFRIYHLAGGPVAACN